jgi:hypothetical protein
MPSLQPTTLAPNLAGTFDSDWSAAQDKYNAAIKAGFDSEDAAQTYLSPVRAKWQIVSKSPALLQNPQQLSDFSKEFNDTTNEFQKRYNSYNVDGGAWAADQTIKPLLEKWSIKASLPQMNPQTTAVEDAYQEYADGKSPRDILKEYPTIALDKSFMSLLRAEVNREDKGPQLTDVQKVTRAGLENRLKAAVAAGPTTFSGGTTLFGQPKDAEQMQNAESVANAQKALNQFDEQYQPQLMRKSAPLQPTQDSAPAVPPTSAPIPWRPRDGRPMRVGADQMTQPYNQSIPGNATVVPQAATPQVVPGKAMTAADKVILANKIAADHPTWTKQQVILAVQGKLVGAE